MADFIADFVKDLFNGQQKPVQASSSGDDGTLPICSHHSSERDMHQITELT
jgi:hypothetical protein